MGRKRRNNVFRMYNLTTDGYSECNVCKRRIKGQHGTNLLVHLKAHQKEYEEVVFMNKMASLAYQDIAKSESKNVLSDHSDSELSTTLDPDNELWGFFDKEPHNRARCSMCSVVLKRDTDTLYRHLKEQHSRISENLEFRDNDENYTEVIYLEDPVSNVDATEPKKTKYEAVKIENVEPPQLKRPKRRYSYKEPLKVCNRQNIQTENKKKDVKDSHNDEIENFGRYITGLLKGVPKDASTKLQMDIVNLIMTAKLRSLEQTTPTITINGTIEVEGEKERENVEDAMDDGQDESTEENNLDTSIDQTQETRKGPDRTIPKKRPKTFNYTEEMACNITLTENEEIEVENFGKYVTSLLKSVTRKEIGTKLQMDIVSLIMSARLKILEKKAPVLTISGTIEVNKDLPVISE